MCHSLFIYSPTEGSLHCFEVLAVTNRSCYKHPCASFYSVNISFHHLWENSKEGDMLNHMVSVWFVRTHQIISQSGCTIFFFCISASNKWQLLLLHATSPASVWCYQCFGFGHSNRCVIVLICIFWWCRASLQMLICHLIHLLLVRHLSRPLVSFLIGLFSPCCVSRVLWPYPILQFLHQTYHILFQFVAWLILFTLTLI